VSAGPAVNNVDSTSLNSAEALAPGADGSLAGANDLSALAWVHAELRRSLEAANKALRRHLKEAEAAAGSDVDAVDPAVLRGARSQLHQGVGALELVGLPAPAAVLRAAEAAVQRLAAKPALVNAAAVETIERVSFALLDFLTRQLAGKPLSPVALFPQYRAAQQLAGVDRIHPADLWPHDWHWQDLPAEPGLEPRVADDHARSAMEALVLPLMRGPDRSMLERMSLLCAELGEGAGGGHRATFWRLAAAVFEAQSSGLLASDVYTKRLASRLLAQLRSGASSNATPAALSDRLAQDLLFFCAHAAAPSAAQPAPRLAAVRRAWRLDAPDASGAAIADYETPRLGRFDPAVVALARKRVAAAKDGWSAVAGGELHRLLGLAEQFALVGDSVQRLFPSGELLGRALQAAAAQTAASEREPAPALAMEVATSMLYLDASIEDGEFDHPTLDERVQRLAQRIDEVRAGADPQPLEPWMEELYRRVSDRQTMGSVVQELRASLSDVEKQIDQYFRDPSQRELLIPVPAQLSSMRGVLSVLGMGQASAAVLHMRDDVDALAQTEVDPQRAIATGTFDRLADNLGALSFLIDMLSVQPQLAKSLFRFDPATGSLSAVMGQSERVSAFAALDEGTAPLAANEAAPVPAEAAVTTPLPAQLQALASELLPGQADDAALVQRLEGLAQQALAADQGELAGTLASARRALASAADPDAKAAARRDLASALAARTAAQPAPEPLPAAAPVPPARDAAPGDTGLEDDAEMREIFVEEAREVVANAGAALARLTDSPESAADMTELRRAFHTLKGSSRMVGLRDFGDAGWGCEQLFNARLAHGARMDAPLRQFTGEALSYLGNWTEAIAAGRDDGHRAAPVVRAADALRLEGVLLAIPAPVLAPAPVPVPQPEPEPIAPVGMQVPGAASVDMATGLPAEGPDEVATAPAAEAAAELPPLAEATEVAAAVELPELPDFAATELDAVPQLPLSDRIGAGESFDFTLDLGPAAAPDLEPVPEVERTLLLPVVTDSVEAAADAPLAPPPGWDLPANAEHLGFEFDLEQAPAAAADRGPDSGPAPLPELTLTPDELMMVSTSAASLAERVPDLPSAADLDLDTALSAIEPAPKSETAAEPVAPDLHEPGFELDLGSFDELQAALPALPADVVAADEAAPVFDGEAPAPAPPPPEVAVAAAEEVELDAEAMARLFDAPADEAPAPVGEAELEAGPAPEPEPVAEVEPELAAIAELEPATALEDDEPVKLIGPLRISIPLFNIFLNEADEQSRRLCIEMAEWSLEHERHAVSESSVALAHSLAGNSATVGYTDLSALGRALEHALMRSQLAGHGRAGEAELFSDAAEEIRRLLHQFAAGFLRPVAPELMERLAEHERLPLPADSLVAEVAEVAEEAVVNEPLAEIAAAEAPAELVAEPQPEPEPGPEPEAPTPSVFDTLASGAATGLLAPVVVTDFLPPTPDEARAGTGARADAFDDDEDIDVLDAIDAELWPIFEEEAEELLPQLQNRLRDWHDAPADPAGAAACMRTLHTLKGGARLAGAMRLGEMAHRLETAIEHLVSREAVKAVDVEPLLARADAMSANFDLLGRGSAGPAEAAEAAAEAPAAVLAAAEVVLEVAAVEAARPEAPAAAEPASEDLLAEPTAAEPTVASALDRIDWQRFSLGDQLPVASTERASGGAAVRVRAGLLDRLVNQAGEVSITRARIDADVRLLQGSLGDLTDSLDRMRRQLRDIEVQAETQMSSRLEAAKAASAAFDPLELDRFTRFQELTRFMAESVNDVATLQRSLQRTLQSTEDELAAQARLTRELQDDLLRTRMVEFESLADRLYRTVRQAAKDSGKQVRLDIVGGAIEVDRGVLDRMTGPFEHLLRNSVAHGVETPAQREAAGKEAAGRITITLAQAGNEVAVEFADDGAGLDLARIRQRGIERGLLAADAQASDAELAQLIFAPGFSTAETVTELAGRGVGMDVVKAEVNAMGGRVETTTAPGQGTRFRLLLPLTTAVTQVVTLRCGGFSAAVPSTLIELVRRVPSAEVEQAYASGSLAFSGENVPFYWLPALLQAGTRGETTGRTQTVIIVRSAAQRVALHVDEVAANQEVVVKNVGPQLARLPGLAGVTLLPSGAVALIYNPVALATLYGDAARLRAAGVGAAAASSEEAAASSAAPRAPLVLVVDDSLTVRRVTQRLLVREGYRVTLAKDGLDALEKLAEERPTVLLSDIEMPRMDGFDLLRNVRADAKLSGLPVVMITSRTAQKHRDVAAELGADHYLGKPYSEEELLALVAGYVGSAEPDIPT
jgi:chemosensory pili system protein ChpA (sensor histidine kinase/response regulator)